MPAFQRFRIAGFHCSQHYWLSYTCSECKQPSLLETNPVQGESGVICKPVHAIMVEVAHPVPTMALSQPSLAATMCMSPCGWPHTPHPVLTHNPCASVLSAQCDVTKSELKRLSCTKYWLTLCWSYSCSINACLTKLNWWIVFAWPNITQSWHCDVVQCTWRYTVQSVWSIQCRQLDGAGIVINMILQEVSC